MRYFHWIKFEFGIIFTLKRIWRFHKKLFIYLHGNDTMVSSNSCLRLTFYVLRQCRNWVESSVSFIIEKLSLSLNASEIGDDVNCLLNHIYYRSHTRSNHFFKWALEFVSEFISIFVNNWVILESSTILRLCDGSRLIS